MAVVFIITEAVSAITASATTITTTVITAEGVGDGGGGVDHAITTVVQATTRTAASGDAPASGSGFWSPW